MDIKTTQGTKTILLCRHDTHKFFHLLVDEAGEHSALMEIIQKKEARREWEARRQGRGDLTELAVSRGFRKTI